MGPIQDIFPSQTCSQIIFLFEKSMDARRNREVFFIQSTFVAQGKWTQGEIIKHILNHM